MEIRRTSAGDPYWDGTERRIPGCGLIERGRGRQRHQFIAWADAWSPDGEPTSKPRHWWAESYIAPRGRGWQIYNRANIREPGDRLSWIGFTLVRRISPDTWIVSSAHGGGRVVDGHGPIGALLLELYFRDLTGCLDP